MSGYPKKTLGILERGKKQHTGDMIEFWTSMWTDEDPELIRSVLDTDGKSYADQVRNWMRNAFKAMHKVKKMEQTPTVEWFAPLLEERIEIELSRPKASVFNIEVSELAKEYGVRRYIVLGALFMLDEERDDWFIGRKTMDSFFVNRKEKEERK